MRGEAGKVDIELIEAAGEALTGPRDPITLAVFLESLPQITKYTVPKKRPFIFQLDVLNQTKTSAGTGFPLFSDAAASGGSGSSNSQLTLALGDHFSFKVPDLTDRLCIVALRSPENAPATTVSATALAKLGQVLISLSNLPHGTSVKRWFQLNPSPAAGPNSSLLLFLKIVVVPPQGTGFVSSSIPKEVRFTKVKITDEKGQNALSHPSSTALVDYFVELGMHLTSFQKALAFSSQSSMEVSSFMSVIHQYPESSRRDFPLPNNLVELCFPYGCFLQFALSNHDLDSREKLDSMTKGFANPICSTRPHCFSFYLSTSDSYVTALAFNQVMKITGEPILGHMQYVLVPRCWCIISRNAFSHKMEQILSTLYRRYWIDDGVEFSSFNIDVSSRDAFGLYAEQYVNLLVNESPCPQPGGPPLNIKFSTNDEIFKFQLPRDHLDLPHLDWPLKEYLFHYLELTVILQLVACILSEQNILIVSSQKAILLPICQSLLSLVFPFKWNSVFIPILPQKAISVLSSPIPFFIGCHPSTLEGIKLSLDVVKVDIDSGNIESHGSLPPLPTDLSNHIHRSLRKLLLPNLCSLDNSTVISSQHIAKLEDKGIRLEFLKFINEVTENYTDHLTFTDDNSPLFDAAGFLNSKPEDMHPLLSKFLRSQLFNNFLEQHVEFPNFLADNLAYILDDFDIQVSAAIDLLGTTVDLPSPLGIDFAETSAEEKRDVFDLIMYKDSSLFVSLSKNSVLNPSRFSQMSTRSFNLKSSDLVMGFYPSVLSQSSLKKLKGKSDSLIRERSQRELFRAKEKKTRIQEIIEHIFQSSSSEKAKAKEKPYSTAELSSYGKFLSLKEWRDVLLTSITVCLPNSGPIPLRQTFFRDLVYLVKICLKECCEDRDFANAKRILDASFRIYSKKQLTAEHSSPKPRHVEHLREHLKTSEIWSLPDFWAYCFLLELISRPLPQESSKKRSKHTRSRSFDKTGPTYAERSFMVDGQFQVLAIDIPKMDSSALQSEKWSNLVYSVAATLFLTMQELSMPADSVNKIIIQIAISQQLSERHLSDLTNLMSTMHRNKEIFQQSTPKGQPVLSYPDDVKENNSFFVSLKKSMGEKINRINHLEEKILVSSGDNAKSSNRDQILEDIRSNSKEKVQEMASEFLKSLHGKRRPRSLMTRKSQ